VKTRPVCSSRPMSMGSSPVGISHKTSCCSRSTTETKSLREHATNARRRATSSAIPAGAGPRGIRAPSRHGDRESIRQAAPTGKAGSSCSSAVAIDARVLPFGETTGQKNCHAPIGSAGALSDAVPIYPDSFRSADMRHAVPLGVPDPFLYAEENGTRHVFTNSMEAARINELGLFDVHVNEEFGIDELVESGLEPRELVAQLALRYVSSLCPKRFTVPENFPVWLADRLRAEGVELDVDQDTFDDRRRAKTGAQLAGMRRAQKAAEAAMDACRELLRRSEISGDELLLDGKQLTVERVKADMNVVFAAHDTTSEEYIVAPGAQGAVGHDMGSGPIRPGVPLVVDIFPRDNESAVFTDMTRTFVVGEVPNDIREWHRLCKEALDAAVAAIRPGVEGRAVFDLTCDIFEAAGEPTQR